MPTMNLDVDVFRNNKVRKLKKKTKAAGVLALIQLWTHVAHQKFGDGILKDYSEEDIEVAADWRGQPGKLFAALSELGFIELKKDANGIVRYAIHDWLEYQIHIGRNREAAKRAADKRWETLQRTVSNTQIVDNQHPKNAEPAKQARTNQAYYQNNNQERDNPNKLLSESRDQDLFTGDQAKQSAPCADGHPLADSPGSDTSCERTIRVYPPRFPRRRETQANKQTDE